jgi:hypothetical protein
LFQNFERERDLEIRRLQSLIQTREDEIQNLISERDSNLVQTQSGTELESENRVLREQIESVQQVLEEERRRHGDVVDEASKSLVSQVSSL